MIILNILEIIVSVVLIVLVLLQMQGSGLSSALGGTGEVFRSKRSIEKILVWATAVVTILFAVISLLLIIPAK